LGKRYSGAWLSIIYTTGLVLLFRRSNPKNQFIRKPILSRFNDDQHQGQGGEEEKKKKGKANLPLYFY